MSFFDPKVVQSPAEQPAVDYLTGSANGPFIDTGVYAMDKLTGRRSGRIYLSIDTVHALAALFDDGPTRNERNSEYARGLADGIKESIGGDLVDVARSIRALFDRLAPVAGAEVDQSGD